VIGISSFAKNDLKDPVKMSFVSSPANLNVWNTRQKRFHFVVGKSQGGKCVIGDLELR